MAKLRVYELARDLNTTNKALLEKLNDLDIDVKSHMSALDDEVIAKIKSSFYGGKSETIVETRIKPNIIRRRRKKVEAAEPVADKEQPVEADTVADVPEAAVESAGEETASAKDAEIAAEEHEALEAAQVEKITEAKEPVAEIKPAVKEIIKPKKPRKKEPAAKIIKLPVKPPEKPLKKKEAPPKKAVVEELPTARETAAPAPKVEEEPQVAETKKRKRELCGCAPSRIKAILRSREFQSGRPAWNSNMKFRVRMPMHCSRSVRNHSSRKTAIRWRMTVLFGKLMNFLGKTRG